MDNNVSNINTQTTRVHTHPALIENYIRHGWRLCLIEPGTKGPNRKEWNKEENAITAMSQVDPKCGVGLLHAYSNTMALDVDDYDTAISELKRHDIDLEQLIHRDENVFIESGRENHIKLLYAMPPGLILPSKKLIGNDRHNYIEFRCATQDGLSVQDILPPTIHPGTKQPYRWGGNSKWWDLPQIPKVLLKFWQKLIKEDKTRVIECDEKFDASWDEIRTALRHIPPDIDRDSWITVGMALNWAGDQTKKLDQAFLLWDQWSAGESDAPCDKYRGTNDLLSAWRSFKPSGGRTIASLFALASRYGWRRIQPSTAELFTGIEVSQPGGGELSDFTFMRPTPPVPEFDAFPKILMQRAQEIAGGVGCDPLVPLSAGLASVCGAANAAMRLRLTDGFEVAPILWMMTIGEPADKKTPGSIPMLKTLTALEAEDRPLHAMRMLEWETQEARYTELRKKYLDYYSCEDLSDEPGDAPEVPVLSSKPVSKKITVQDITSQKLVRKAENRPEGLLCWLDEMHAWVKKITDPRSTEDRSSWVAAYESQPYEMERVGAGAIYCENLAVAIYGNIQPRVLSRALRNLGDDGIIQRFIPAILRPEMTGLGNPIPRTLSSEEVWEQTIRKIHALPIRTYVLNRYAWEEFRKFQRWYEETKREERILMSDDSFLGAYGKLEGLAGRLALIFHLIETPNVDEVSRELMSRVVRVIKYQVVPSLRYLYGQYGKVEERNLHHWMAEHVLLCSGLHEKITLRDLKRSAKRQLGEGPSWMKNAMIKDAMYPLEKSHWVICTVDEPNKGEWLINPLVAKKFKDHRQRIILLRQKRLDENTRIACKSGKGVKRKFTPGFEQIPEEDSDL